MAGRGTSAKTAEKVEPEVEAEKVEPEVEAEKVEPAAGEVTVRVAVGISGLRNGEPWPAVGEPITLPADEAASYIQFGYVVPIEG